MKRLYRSWSLTIPNLITLGRPLALIPFAYFWFGGDQVIAFVVFILAALSDVLDGWLARLLGHDSAWGKAMDPVADKLFVYGTVLLLIPELWLFALALVALIFVRDWNVETLRLDYPYRAPLVPTLFSAKVKTVLFMVGLACVIAAGSPLDRLFVSAMTLANLVLFAALVSALYSWRLYVEEFRVDEANSRF